MQCRPVFSARSSWMAAVLPFFLANIGIVWSGDLLVFPSISGVVRISGDDIHKKQDFQPALDIFFSMKREPILFLAEFFVSRDEHEMERLQVGIAPNASNKIWMGRFHTPLSYWNTAYHHGAYLQPSITRPGIAEYEDEQGILPMHLTGILLDGSKELSQTRLNYELAVGVGPILKDALTPMNITAPSAEGRFSISSKLGFQPLNSDANETGVFGGYTEIPIRDGLYTNAKQIVAGAFYNKEWSQWRFIGELTFIQSRLENPLGVSRSSFANVYVHGEYKVSEKLTGYGRVEASANAHNPYLQMFPGFISARALIGGRWEPLPKQAIKFELIRNERQDNHRYNELGVQWSMVFP